MASALSALVFILSSACIARGVQDGHPSSTIKLESTLSPVGNPWSSPSRHFAFGFYSQGDGFKVGIWLNGSGTTDNKVVWTANRNDPPVSWNATLRLNERGLLLFTNDDRSGEGRVIANNSSSTAYSASMLDSGNFVIYNKDGHTIIWESFKNPTDTILGGQILSTGGELVSSLSQNNLSTGKFHLKMQEDGNLVLYPIGSEDAPKDAYWATGTNGNQNHYHLYLNFTEGTLQLINNTDSSIVHTDTLHNTYAPVDDDNNLVSNSSTVYRATVDVDGIFRLYAHPFQTSGKFLTQIRFQAVENACKVKGYCGFNSYCTFNDIQPYCVCLPGTDFVDPYQGTSGCKRNYSEANCEGSKANIKSFNITPVENLDWGPSTYYSIEKMSKDECNVTCLEDCNCEVALFKNGVCKKQKLPLMYVVRDSQSQQKFSTVLFMKVGVRGLVAENNSVPHEREPPLMPPIKRKEPMVRILVLTFSLVVCCCVLLAISGLLIYKFQVLRYKRLLENGNFGPTEELTLIVFSYHELKRATNGFKEELGKGSFGAVYKGALYKGRKPVAVKRLEKLVEEGEREFQAEMRAIGRTHHRNLVHLLGYCAEDSKRLLVYEFMANGSLADLLFKSTGRPDWNERFRIALDVARGILYLHEECENPIIHCDIKPQNILMDDSWTAKISDFGLAKLLMGDQTRTFTGVRGTRGYMAPEWHKNTPISVKADIFSFGIVLLEIVFCRRNLDTGVSKPEEVILSTWVYRCFVEKELDKLVLGEEVDKQTLERMAMVALWCIQDEPALRPSMKRVVMMLEGITDIPIPPCPTASSM